MPPPLTPYQKRKHREALDEKYLEKQLVFLNQHKFNYIYSFFVSKYCLYLSELLENRSQLTDDVVIK